MGPDKAERETEPVQPDPEIPEEAGADAGPAVERVPYLGFVVAGEMYGLPLDQLREVARLKRLRRIPGAPPNVAGLMNLRGQIVCALDTRAMLRLAVPPPSGAGYLVALRGFSDPLGLVVDSVTDVYPLDPGLTEPPPASWSAARTMFSIGTAATAKGPIVLLDVKRMIGVLA